MKLRWLLLIAMVCFPAVSGKSTGAPDDVCDVSPLTLEPGHGGTPKDGKSAPYTVTASTDSYSEESTIKVTIKGNGDNKFKGFAIGVKDKSSNKLIGSWESSSIAHTVKKCSGIITHNNADDKPSVSVTWKAPKSSGSVKFVVTIVKELKTYWTNVPVKVQA